VSVRLPYRKEIVVDGRTYVRGPELPPGVDKHSVCAGAALGKCCFGHDCLHIAGLYWVEKPAGAEADAAPVTMMTCPKCGKRRKSNRFDTVRTGESETQIWCLDCLAGHAEICERCGEACVTGLLSTVDGAERWCPKCLSTHAVKCAHCGKHGSFDSVKEVVTESGAVEKWCASCYSSCSTECGHCHRRILNNRLVDVDGQNWCQACAEAHTTACSLCGRRTGRAVDDPSGDGGQICRNCAENRSAGIVLSYHGLPRSRLKFWGESGLYLGFELEAGNAPEAKYHMAAIRVNAIDPGRNHYHLERDGSIPGNGFELVSAPHTLEEHKKFNWAKVVKTMADNGLRSHDCGGRCGLHVHVSRDFLSSNDRVNIDAFVLRNKTFWERIARRTQSDYARYLNKPDDQMGNSSERYCAVNFRPNDTVEFRLFRGTLRFTTLMATLEIVDGLCRWVKTRTVDQVLRNDGEVDNFVAWLAYPARAAVYANATAYIAERRAVTDANTGVQDQTSPDL
jgi:hypothetical protein